LLVERAVRASWMLDRCTRAEDAALATRVRHAADDFLQAAREEAESLGRRLTDDETNYKYHLNLRTPIAVDLLEQSRRDDPPLLVMRLGSFAAGADWLLARWRELDVTLDRLGHWHYSETYRAIRLLGKRPVDVFDDSIVRLVVLAANAADPETPNLAVEVQRMLGQTHNKPSSYERIMTLVPEVPTAANGLAMLRVVIASEIDRLESLKITRLDRLARLDIECATARAAFDDSESGSLRHRYEASRERALHRALADLARMAKAKAAEPAVSPKPSSAATSEMGSFREMALPSVLPTPETSPEPRPWLQSPPRQPVERLVPVP
jgi:hypothetical protein